MRLVNGKWYRRIPSGWMTNGKGRVDIPLSIATDPTVNAVVLEPPGMVPVEFPMEGFRRAIERLWVRPNFPNRVVPFDVDFRSSTVNGTQLR